MIGKWMMPAAAGLLVCGLLVFATPAAAQFSGGSGTTPTTIPGMIVPNQNLTPEQMQSIMMMRALQGRGRGQVRTGVPQVDPFYGQGGMQPGFDPTMQGGVVDDGSASRKNSIQRRTEARKAQEEQKRAARDAAKAKKGGKDKKGAAANAAADKKALAKNALAKKAAEKKAPAKKPVEKKSKLARADDED